MLEELLLDSLEDDSDETGSEEDELASEEEGAPEEDETLEEEVASEELDGKFEVSASSEEGRGSSLNEDSRLGSTLESGVAIEAEELSGTPLQESSSDNAESG